jgi:hypothetical protein
MKALVCCVFILSIVATSAFGQAVPTPDPIKGVWKLNLDKSKNAMAGLESEVITILAQDSSHQLTFDVKQSNGYNPKYDIVTDMKGGTVRPVNADGRGTNDSWRVARQGKKAFEMELKNRFGEWTDKYEVSFDGKTMKRHRVPSPNNMVIEGPDTRPIPSREPQSILVFDRVE